MATATQSDRALVRLLDKEFRQNATEETKVTGIPPNRFLMMLEESKDPVATAKQLIHSHKITEGLTRLWQKQRLDLSVEAVILQVRFFPLFTHDDRIAALRHLEDLM